MTKVQLSLISQEATLLENYGAQFGYNLPKTIRFFISKASEKILKNGIPIFVMSKRIEENGLKALEEHCLGKTHEMNDADEFFDSL